MSNEALTNMSPQLARTVLQIFAGLVGAGLLAAGAALWWSQRRGRSRDRPGQTGSATDEVAEPPARRILRIGFGLLWIVDGLLQAQPAMPAGFVAHTLTPGIDSGPGWLSDLVRPVAQAWAHHPVTADSVTVFVQLGLGLLVLLGGRGLLAKVALWASLSWCVVVWVGGEFFGGLLAPGASWLTGAPGAILVYALAAGLLLLRWDRWDSGEAMKLTRRAVGVWFLVGATLQALPWEGNWAGPALRAPFEIGAHTGQPTVMLAPIIAAARLAQAQPFAVNASIIVVLVIIGAGLLLAPTSAGAFVGAGVAWCLVTWWLAQDFGVLGGLATDPNSALPLAVVLAAGWPRWRARTEVNEVDVDFRSTVERGLPLRAALATLGIGAVFAVPLLLAGSLLGPPDASAVEADSSGGVITLSRRPAPEFTLTDQTGSQVSMSRLRGTLTLVTFLDPVCSDDCPVIANQIAAADRALGPLARRVQIVAIDTNPIFTHVVDVEAFTRSHGLGDLGNWHFLAGEPGQLGDVLAAYGIVVQVPAVGMIAHGEGIYFISAQGTQIAYLGDGANPQLSRGYSTLIEQEIRRLLLG